MVNVLASVDFIRKIIYKYEHYTISDFGTSREIDIESFIFFKKIITENKAHLYLNISDEKIEHYKINPNEADIEEKDIAQFVNSFKHAKLYSNVDLYNCLIQFKEIDLPLNKLPCYLLLDNVSEEICKRIEQFYGINCFSLKRLFVEEKYRISKPYTIKNTKDGLFEKLNLFNYHSLELYDPYFISNSSVKGGNDINFEFLKRIKLNGIKKIEVTIHSNLVLGNFPINEFDKRKNIFEEDINFFNTENGCNLKLFITKKAKHDRFVFTNTCINMVGNSFNKNSETYLTTFPQIIYNDYYR
jgi:hypothetical protein